MVDRLLGSYEPGARLSSSHSLIGAVCLGLVVMFDIVESTNVSAQGLAELISNQYAKYEWCTLDFHGQSSINQKSSTASRALLFFYVLLDASFAEHESQP